MPAQLVPIHPSDAQPVVISRPVILIGRHLECDVRIDSPQVSRRHCCLALAYDRLVIRDLGSSNGVRVNGRLIDEIGLSDGDEVAIAQFLYRLVDDVPAVKPSAGSKSLTPVRDESPILDLSDDFIPLDD